MYKVGVAANSSGLESMRGPDSKPHFVVTRRTIVNADMRVTLLRRWVDACDVHFFAAPALG